MSQKTEKNWQDQLIDDIAGIGGTGHIPLFTGTIYYVDAGQSDDTGEGTTPGTAKKTIGAAITAASAGDAITVKAGTYTENSLDMNKAGLELWGEIGVTITPAGSTTCLVVSGNDCLVRGINVTKGGQIGIQVTGDGCAISDCIADGCSIAYDIDGSNTLMERCQDLDATTTGYDISSAKNLLRDCSTIATGGASRGFYLSNAAADQNFLINCSSVGNGTAGYEIITGAAYNVLKNCSSGGGDGRWVDADGATKFSNFTYDDVLYKTISVDSAQTINMFQVTGTVRISEVVGTVKEIITSAGAPTIHLSVFSANGEVDITDDPGPDIINDVVGTVYVKNNVSTSALTKGENDNTPFIIENGNYRDPDVAIDVGADDAATTYIRWNSNAACTDGQIEWHIKWEPVTDDGFLEVV